MVGESTPRRIDVSCPDCGSTQSEPTLAVSTQCRACGAHFQIENGKAIAKHKMSQVRIRKTSPQDEEAFASSSPASSVLPWLHKKNESQPPAPTGLIQRILSRPKEPRKISCPACHHAYTVAAEAQSSQCPKCSTYISFIDYEIDSPCHRKIETRGNVVIRKTGSIIGMPICCHNLTVMGKISGSIDCSGDLVFRHDAKILGLIRCAQLIVEKNTTLECLESLRCSSAIIRGEVHGKIICSGTITLEKRALLIGDIKTKSLAIREGAKHQGKIEIVSEATSSAI